MSEEETTFLLVVRLAAGSVLPMALKYALELDLLHLIKKYGTGLGTGASASELAAQPPTINPNAAGIIDRVLDSLLPIMSLLAPSIRCPTAEFEKTKKAFEMVSKRPETLSWPWDAAKHMKSAATSAKDFAWCI